MALQISNILFGFNPSASVLNGISIDVNKGETLAIVGASGCGKSTLLRLVSGILPNSKSDTFSGTITIEGTLPNDYVKKGKLAFMFQEAALMPNLNVKENIALPLKIKGIKDDAKVNALIATVGLTEYANYLPKQLSGGMKTRVSLARSFVTQPELLLLDEPFSALDIAWKSKLYVELEKLRNKYNTTVVIVTHDVQEALLLSNQVIVLSKGGTIIGEEVVESNLSVEERINDISEFNNTDTFKNLYSSIQKWIMDDGVRATASKSDVERILNKIFQAAGSENEHWDSLKQDVISLRSFSNDTIVYEKMFDCFNKANSFFLKYELIWDILEYREIDELKVNLIADFYLQHIETASQKALKYYNLNAEKLFEYLVKTRIENMKYPESKRWIYLCDVYASSEKQKVIQYLETVLAGQNQYLNFGIAKRVAAMVKEKIENEEKNYISVA